MPGILGGAVTAFAACLGEFGAIITFVSNIPGETRTIPLAIYTAIQSARRRGGSGALGRALHCARARGTRTGRRAGAPCPRGARLMSDPSSFATRFGAFRLDAAFEFGDRAGVTALFGPSGAGKSTVINAIAGLLRPEFGRIVLGGETLLDTDRGVSIPARARRVGVVFQDTRLFPHLTVKANLLYGWQRTNAKADAPGIDAVISLLALERFLDRRPRTLSGGEKSRVALGRALLMNPRALLLDEPLAALDAARKAEILPYLDRLVRETKIPMLYVSHSLDEVARLADRMVLIDKGRVDRRRLALRGHAAARPDRGQGAPAGRGARSEHRRPRRGARPHRSRARGRAPGRASHRQGPRRDVSVYGSTRRTSCWRSRAPRG